MGDGYGWTDNGRHAFNAQLLEEAAAELRKKSPQELKEMLLQGLFPVASFGLIDGADAAWARLGMAYKTLTAELEKVGIDLADLAFRSLVAANAAREVEVQTRRAAHLARIDDMYG